MSQHDIRIEASGYETYTQTYKGNPQDGQTITITAELTPLKTTIPITIPTTIPTSHPIPIPTQDPAVFNGVRLVSHSSGSEYGMPFVTGNIKNENPYTVSVSIKAQFKDKDYVVIDDSLDFISDLNPRQTARYKIISLGAKPEEFAYYYVWIDAVYPK